jgi:basic amino acid/polyamine antiporter, APA family
MKPQLKQTLGLFTAVMVVVSAMIGSGVFKKIAPMSALLGNSTAIIICWVVAGLITLFGALSNAEVASSIAKAGGQFVYFKRMYGKFFAFLYGWSSFAVIQTATTASVAFVFAESLNELIELPILSSSVANFSFLGLYPLQNFGVKLVATILVVLLTFINIRGVENGGFIGNLLASTILISMALLVFFGFFYSPEISPTNFASFNPNSVTASIGISSFFSAMLAAFWAFEGWNTVGFLGGEIKNPKKYIPLALGFGVIIVIANYVLVNAAFLNVMSVESFAKMNEENVKGANIIPALEVMRNLLGSPGAILIGLLILMSTFNSSNNSIMTSPRVYFAMAKESMWWKQFAKVHPLFQTPITALLAHALVSILFIWSGSFDALTDMLVFAAFIFYGAGALGVFVVRKKFKQIPGAFRVPTIVPILFVLFSLGLVINSLITNFYGSMVGLVLVLLGIPIYFWFVGKRKSRLK